MKYNHCKSIAERGRPMSTTFALQEQQWNPKKGSCAIIDPNYCFNGQPNTADSKMNRCGTLFNRNDILNLFYRQMTTMNVQNIAMQDDKIKHSIIYICFCIRGIKSNLYNIK